MARLLNIVGLFLTLAAAASLNSRTVVLADSTAASYDDLCDLMITYAQKAAQAHNTKKFDDAEEYSAKVEEVFNKAVAMDATEPQAYLNMATYQSNTHQFDESIANYNKVLEIFAADGDANQEMQFRIEKQRDLAYFRKYSKLRDLAYQSGDGNTTLAYEYALKQLQYTPEPQRTNHQLATLEAMLCEYNQTMCTKSHTHFRVSSFATFQHVTRFISERISDKARMRCFHSKLNVGMWAANAESEQLSGNGGLAAGSDNKATQLLHPFMQPYANNTREDLSAANAGVYVNTLRGIYDIQGSDGIIMANVGRGTNPGDCSVFVQNGDYYVNLADNLFPVDNNNNNGPAMLRPPPQHSLPASTKVFSLVQFASSTFFHWMAESLPKLVYFRQTYPDAEMYKILVPAKHTDVTKKGAIPKFMRDTLTMFGVDLKTDVIGYVAKSGLTVDSRRKEDGGKDGELVAVTWDPSPCPGEKEFAANLPERRMCASLSPADALQVARRAISAACRSQATLHLPEGPYVVVVGRGKGVSSRGINTTRVAELLQETLTNSVELIDNRPIDHDATAMQGGASPAAPARKKYADDGQPLKAPEERSIRVVEFAADDYGVGDALNLFRGASLVVGPHGGALSNLMACEAGKTAVLEVGLSTVAAQHYKHMASSLGLRYRRLVAGPDRLRRALNAPSLNAKSDVIVSNAVELLLAQLGSDVAIRKTQIPKGPAARAAEEAAKAREAAAKEASSTAYTAPADDDEYLSYENEEDDEDAAEL